MTSSRRSILRATREAQKRCPAGCIIVSNLLRGVYEFGPLMRGRWFEATPLSELMRRLRDVESDEEQSVRIRGVRRLSRIAGLIGGPAPPLPAVKALLILSLLILMFPFLAFADRILGIFGSTTLLMVMLTFPFLGSCLYILWRRGFLGRLELLVPGGLVVGRSPMWRKRGVAFFAHRHNATFLVDMFMGHTDVAVGNRVLKVRATTHIISTLINPSRTPTREEIASFLGPKYDVRDR